jgi:hypothetical protein
MGTKVPNTMFSEVRAVAAKYNVVIDISAVASLLTPEGVVKLVQAIQAGMPPSK